MNPRVLPASCRQTDRRKALPARCRQHLRGGGASVQGSWLSGDFNVEQHIHLLDLCSWIMKDEYPARAYGTGGRQVRTGPEYGNIYDHHATRLA